MRVGVNEDLWCDTSPVPARVFVSTGCVNAAANVPASASSAPVSAPAVAIQPVGAPVLLLGNPNAGDVVSHGDYVVSGLAFDPSVSSSSGVDRVDFFLDNRDSGGQFLGSVIPGVAVRIIPVPSAVRFSFRPI